MEQRAKRRYTRKEAQQTLPAVRDFNKLASTFLKLLGQKIEKKQERLNKVSYMINGFTPTPKWHNTINVQTIDMQNTIVRRQGNTSYNQNMNWEDDFRKRKKGIVL